MAMSFRSVRSSRSSNAKVDDDLLPQRQTAHPEFYVVDGKRIESEEEFLKEANKAVEEGGVRSSFVKRELDDTAKIQAVTKQLCDHYGGEGARLKPSQMEGLMKSVAAEFHLNPKDFPNVQDMFWRFDFSGDGALDEDEVQQLVVCMLRHHRDKVFGAGRGKERYINLPRKSLKNLYRLHRKLGQGGQGAVYLGDELASGKSRVVKFFRKGDVNAPLDDIKDEFALLTKLDHPRIQRLYDIFEDREYVYIVSEPYLGGDLQDLVPKASKQGINVTMRWLGRVAQQVVQGVAYLHSRHIMHCDLKEANAVIATPDLTEPSVVVIDFGLADKLVGEGAGVSGTPGYMPPEVWAFGLWTPKGDIHALGVMLYQMFCGEKCFPAATILDIKRRTCSSPPFLEPLQGYPHLAPLVDSMLSKKLSNRPTASRVLESPFFGCLTDGEEIDLSPEVLAALSKLSKISDVQAAILSGIAGSENLAQLRNLNDAFMALDGNNDGCITQEVAKAKLSEVFPADLVESVVAALIDDTGQVAYTRFMAQVMLALNKDVQGLLWREFVALDTDESGALTLPEVSDLLKRPALESVLVGKTAEDLMKLMDTDESGNITWEEFIQAVLPDASRNPGDGKECEVQIQRGQSRFSVRLALASDTVEQAKEKIRRESERHGVNMNEQFDLALQGKVLHDSMSLHGCQLSTQSTLEVRANSEGHATSSAGLASKRRKSEDQEKAENTTVKWKSNGLVHMTSYRAMHEHSCTILLANTCTMLFCCSWPVPVFFLAAQNVAEDCGTTLALWLRLSCLVFVVGTPLVHLLIFLGAKAKVKVCFTNMQKLLCTMPMINIVLGVLGFYYYAADSDNECVKDEEGSVQPNTLAVVWGSICTLAVCLTALAGMFVRGLMEVHAASKTPEVHPL